MAAVWERCHCRQCNIVMAKQTPNLREPLNRATVLWHVAAYLARLAAAVLLLLLVVLAERVLLLVAVVPHSAQPVAPLVHVRCCRMAL